MPLQLSDDAAVVRPRMFSALALHVHNTSYEQPRSTALHSMNKCFGSHYVLNYLVDSMYPCFALLLASCFGVHTVFCRHPVC